MISYDGWDREYKENKIAYFELFNEFMSQTNYENNEEWERNFAKRFNRKHCISVASATDALHFSLLAHNIGPGDEVLVTDFSWISSSSCVSMVGATPVFCDIDLDTYQLSFESIKRMYTDKVKALIYVHLFGNMVDTTEIQEFCKEKNIIFIEDAAQSLGSSYNQINAGSIGDCSIFSFNSNKVIAGINGGGVILTDCNDIAKHLRMIRRHGKDKSFDILGFNSRMYVFNAKIINLRLQQSEKYQQKRQEIAKKYDEAFLNLPIYTQSTPNGLNHNYHKYVIRFNDTETRNRVKSALKATVHYDLPLSANNMYKNQSIKKDNCVNSSIAANTVLSLPIHAWLTDDEVDTIIKTVLDNF